ncbi:sensor histidine kinase [Bacillus piscicola]|uniref:sensor histidine kinase n=1 Tax=Bacillus piscicola TaxID=1632684 RepID=UPI001F09D633|nr:HAMP domain-containing sensor histidine kinase [Bacillus piscicola]
MKLKTWLLFSYFIVMILPLAAAYTLFAWINAYHEDQKVEEYFQKWTELQAITSVLEDPTLYQPNVERPQVDNLVQPQVSIVLYNDDGLVLYASDPVNASSFLALGREERYKNLYSLEQGYRTYRYKQPVLSENELVGFFEVEMARDEWTAGVEDRSWFMAGVFIVFFLLIYLTVVYLVNRKLTRRLNRLMKQMTAFANREEVEEVPTEKDEIGELTTHFNGMRQQIEAARKKIAKEQQEKEYMIATISHDLKTPLTSIRAYTESLVSERELSVEERMEYRDVVVNKAHYMKQMLDDLLMYTLLQSPAYEMELVEVDGNEFFDMLVSDYEPLCKEKNIHLHVHCDVTGKYRVNPKQMVRVADNLMSNAIRHTKEGGHIWMTAISADRPLPDWMVPFLLPLLKEQNVDAAQDNVYLIVQNQGKGITDEKLSHVFDPLYQADQARSKKDARGTGLGLSITKQIMDKHGGEVRILSNKGIGTCVMCKLPKLQRKGEDDETN